MKVNYLGIRLSHYRITLKSWFKGLDKALLASIAALQFILTAIVTVLLIGLAQALLLLDRPDTGMAPRLAVIAGWQVASFILLRATREATFMPRPRAFFDSLPVPAVHKLRADLLLSLASYSLLWLPVAWALVDPFDQSRGPRAGLFAAIAELAVLSLSLNISLLRGSRASAPLVLCLLAYALIPGPATPPALARLACACLAGMVLWRSYLPGTVRAGGPARRNALADALALRSGLVVPLLASELRANLLVRVGLITATLLACLAVIHFRTNDTSSVSVVVFVAAAAALALYTLPALCRETLLTKVGFLAGQPAFAARMRPAIYGIPVLLFVVALASGWPFDRSGRTALDGGVFSLWFVAGVIGARLRWAPTSWLMPFGVLVSLIILAAMT